MLLLIVGAILLLSFSESWQDTHNLPFQDIASFDTSEITLGTRLFSFVNDREFAFVVSSAELPDSEDFSLTKPAPLSIKDAVASASQTLPKYVSIDDTPNWFVSAVILSRCTASKWYYVVDYKPKKARLGVGGSVNQMRIPVMFNSGIPEGVARVNQKKRKRDFEMAAESLGITTEELLQRGQGVAEESMRCVDLSFISDVGSQIFKFDISSAQLEKSDSVDVNQQLPFSLHDAVAAALNASRLYIPLGERAGWKIEEVSLQRWGRSEKWYYLVIFKVESAVSMPIELQLQIPVLMNGETVKGQRIKTSL